jgi:DNA-binding MarR family transcriptional regulator
MYRDPRNVVRDRIVDREVRRLELRQLRERERQPSDRRRTLIDRSSRGPTIAA